MVKRREPKATSAQRQYEPSKEEIERFAAGADATVTSIVVGPKDKKPDPAAKRDYKAIRVPFNEHEYKLLEEAAEKVGRSKLNFMRHAMLEMAKEVLE